jgi:hypothetical protein
VRQASARCGKQLSIFKLCGSTTRLQLVGLTITTIATLPLLSSLVWRNFNTYWEKLIIEPKYSYYTIATALHPRLRLNWFKSAWRDYPDWYWKADTSLYKTFDKYAAVEIEQDELQAEEQQL